MTREQKVKSLQAIQERRLLPDDLGKAKIYLFKEVRETDPKLYDSDFGMIDFQKMETIIHDIELKNTRRALCGLPTDQIIVLNYTKFEGKTNLTLNIQQ